ncbi:MAG: DUF1697 domain-containing protein [Gammaproteobacteria bacterium]
METWIALLRGINVGGRNRLPMKDLSRIFEAAGCAPVKTYIQSGNVVFKAGLRSGGTFADAIGTAIEKQHGFRPAIQLRTATALKTAIASNPYPQAASEPKSLHLFFLEDSPQKKLVSDARRLLSASESITVIDRCLYLHAPDGLAQSKFAKGVDKALGMNTTARNWRTVSKLEDLASTIE